MGLDPALLHSQTRAQLEATRLAIIQRIEDADKELKKVNSDKLATLADFRLLERKIKDRERLVSAIQNELIISEKELESTESKTQSLKTDLSSLKDRYYNLLHAAYKQNLSFNKWAFIFNAQSVNDSFQRWKYLKQYEAYCKKAYQNLINTNDDLAESIDVLNIAISERQSLLKQEQEQFGLIKKELAQKDKFLQDLSEQQSALKADIEAQKKSREKLNNAIENIIVAALKGDTERYKADPLKTEETSFISMKDQLPWPVKLGRITSKYGRHRHPTLQEVYTQNNGIDITTSDQNAEAVHNGIVVGINNIPGYGRTIIIKHGKYYTVYSRLEQIYLENGQQVNKGDIVGTISKSDSGEYIVHFEIWEGKKKLNPTDWIN